MCMHWNVELNVIVFKGINGITPVYMVGVYRTGAWNELEKAFADMVVDAVMDIRAKIRKCRFETDATLKVFILINVWGCQWGIAVVSKQLKIFYLVSKQLKKCKQQKNV